MSLIVQKFGGSSVGDVQRMRRCAEHVAAARADGHRVVVVVSARGDTTDELLALADEVGAGPAPDRRELDQLLATGEQVSIALLAMMLQGMGHAAVSLTGAQCGIRTDAAHTRARIVSIDTARLEAELAAGRIPVVAGFQGITEAGETTTLGRGGSDTTAVAVAAALKADECQIFTDVDGVYTADPRVAPGAQRLDRISYDEMMEAASQGAKVMHLRAVELGKKSGVPIRVLHSQRGPGGGAGGTLITDEVASLEGGRAVSIVALKTDIGRFTLAGVPNVAGLQRRVFDPIAAAGINVDDIIQTEVVEAAPEPGEGDGCNLVFTLDRGDLAEARPLVERVVAGLGRGRVQVDLGLSKVSAVGVGMQSQPGVAATMFRALSDAAREGDGGGEGGGGIRVANITTSEVRISCIVDERDGRRALRAVHAAFGLGRASGAGAGGPAASPSSNVLLA